MKSADSYLDRMTIIRFDRDRKCAPEGIDGMYVQITRYPGYAGSVNFETLTLICMSNSAMHVYENAVPETGERHIVPYRFSKDKRIEDIVFLFYDIFQATAKGLSNENLWNDLRISVDRFVKNSNFQFTQCKDQQHPTRGTDTIEFNKYRIYADKGHVKSLRI